MKIIYIITAYTIVVSRKNDDNNVEQNKTRRRRRKRAIQTIEGVTVRISRQNCLFFRQFCIYRINKSEL